MERGACETLNGRYKQRRVFPTGRLGSHTLVAFASTRSMSYRMNGMPPKWPRVPVPLASAIGGTSYFLVLFRAASMPQPMSDDVTTTRERLSLVVDVVMLVLIIANLTLIIVDWIFESTLVQAALRDAVPAVYHGYNDTIHQHFVLYDLAFVAVFVTEIGIRWGLAIYRQRYRRWFFYPFAHWYDVLGCIPVSSLRSLRLLRLIAMVPKMQRLGLVNLRKTWLYRTFIYYRDIVFEEITDRVAVRVIQGIQHEVRKGHPVTGEIVEEVLKPQRERLTETMTERLQNATAAAYRSYKPDFRTYLDGVIATAVDRNREIATIASIPGVGPTMANLLENAISDIVYRVIDQMMADVGARENNEVVAQIAAISTDALMTPDDDRLARITQSVLLQSLDLIKEHIEIQQWKLEGSARRPTD